MKTIIGSLMLSMLVAALAGFISFKVGVWVAFQAFAAVGFIMVWIGIAVELIYKR